MSESGNPKPEGTSRVPAEKTAEQQAGRTPGTRLLKDVEAEENRILYETLYKSLDDAEDEKVEDELKIGDTVRGAREAKKDFLDAVGKPISSKAKDCGTLYRQMSDTRNAQVLSRFVLASALMLTVPLVALVLGMKVVAPVWQLDDVLCGGFAAVGSTILIGAGYVIYAFVEDSARERPQTSTSASAASSAKKNA